jgi:hypothetical protein
MRSVSSSISLSFNSLEVFFFLFFSVTFLHVETLINDMGKAKSEDQETSAYIYRNSTY